MIEIEQQLKNEIYALARIIAQQNLALEQAGAQLEDLAKKLEAAETRVRVLEETTDGPSD
jgi:uncharacterized coiled-coil protein SlyX